MFLILLLVSCLFLFRYVFFQWFSHALSIESSSSVLSFCFTFSVSVNLGETITYFCLKVLILCGKSLCRLCVPDTFGGGAGFGMNASHILGCSGGYYLGRGWSWRWRGYSLSWLWDRTSSLLSGYGHPFKGMVWSQVAGVKPGESGLSCSSVPFKCVFFPLSTPGPLLQSEGVLKQVGSLWPLGMYGWGRAVVEQPLSEIWAASGVLLE